MSLAFNSKTYTLDSNDANSALYAGASNTVSTRDLALLRRLAIKASDVFSGVSRTFAKLSRTLTLTGAKTATGEAYVNIEVMVPVGFAPADVDALLTDAAALMGTASFKSHVKARQIIF